MQVKWNGETEFLVLTHNKDYEVLAIERGWYRLIDDSGEDYLYPPDQFEILDHSGESALIENDRYTSHSMSQ